jgi:hypothetical protein
MHTFDLTVLTKLVMDIIISDTLCQIGYVENIACNVNFDKF